MLVEVDDVFVFFFYFVLFWCSHPSVTPEAHYCKHTHTHNTSQKTHLNLVSLLSLSLYLAIQKFFSSIHSRKIIKQEKRRPLNSFVNFEKISHKMFFFSLHSRFNIWNFQFLFLNLIFFLLFDSLHHPPHDTNIRDVVFFYCYCRQVHFFLESKDEFVSFVDLNNKVRYEYSKE